MHTPLLTYNEKLYKYCSAINKTVKETMWIDLEVLGNGACGTTYSAYCKADNITGSYVLKEHEKNDHCTNEIEGLKYIRTQMLNGTIPGYFIFMYDFFTSGDWNYIILEKADYSLEDYMMKFNHDTKKYLEIFWHIANAISYLEELEFNHGDLWDANIMLSWLDDQEESEIDDKLFTIKIIDLDSAFKEDSLVTSPSLGGSDYYRDKFILGYDLNRFFDALLFSYKDYVEKKKQHKIKKIKKMTILKKKDKKIVIPSLDEDDDSDIEFDNDNVIYPPEIIKFMLDLKPTDPDNFKDNPGMSGNSIKMKIEKYANELELELF